MRRKKKLTNTIIKSIFIILILIAGYFNVDITQITERFK